VDQLLAQVFDCGAAPLDPLFSDPLVANENNLIWLPASRPGGWLRTKGVRPTIYAHQAASENYAALGKNRLPPPLRIHTCSRACMDEIFEQALAASANALRP
jgi:hypothetical protein